MMVSSNLYGGLMFVNWWSTQAVPGLPISIAAYPSQLMLLGVG